MKNIKYILFSIFLFLMIGSVSAKEITVNLFYSKTCPHCAAEKEFLEEYKNENENFKVRLFEVTEDEDNSKLLGDVKETLGVTHNYVPYTVIGEYGLTGFSDNIESQIKHFIEKYQTEEYSDLVSKVEDAGSAIELDKDDLKDNEQESEIDEVS